MMKRTIYLILFFVFKFFFLLGPNQPRIIIKVRLAKFCNLDPLIHTKTIMIHYPLTVFSSELPFCVYIQGDRLWQVIPTASTCSLSPFQVSPPPTTQTTEKIPCCFFLGDDRDFMIIIISNEFAMRVQILEGTSRA